MKLTHKSGAFGGCKAWRSQRPGEAPAISGRHMPNFLTSDARRSALRDETAPPVPR